MHKFFANILLFNKGETHLFIIRLIILLILKFWEYTGKKQEECRIIWKVVYICFHLFNFNWHGKYFLQNRAVIILLTFTKGSKKLSKLCVTKLKGNISLSRELRRDAGQLVVSLHFLRSLGGKGGNINIWTNYRIQAMYCKHITRKNPPKFASNQAFRKELFDQ